MHIHNTESFIKNSNEIWSNIYSYIKVNYVKSNVKVIIICKTHGEFEQLPHNHLKYGCGTCGRSLNKRNNYLKETCKLQFVEKSNKVHENKYDYSKTIYKNVVTKVYVLCKIHGDFSISPNNHLRGKGCPLCGRQKANISKLKDFSDYQPEFIKLYGDKYDYSSVVWNGGSRYITVICKSHGTFNILPWCHKNGKECPKCSNRCSSISIEWLMLMEVRYSRIIHHAKNFGEFVIPETRYKADGYVEDLNTIFEFHGDFWHGNPKIYNELAINPRTGITYGELYKTTVEKSNFIRSKGYNLIEIWEHDWKKLIKSVRILQKKWSSRNNGNS